MIWQYSAGVIPFIEDSGRRKFLLLQSALTKEELWEFPKGLIEKGEDAETAAKREFSEETGINEFELIPGFKKALKYFYKREDTLVGKTVTYFLGRVRSEKVQISSEARSYEWLTFEQALKRVKHKNIRQMINDVQEFLEGRSGKPQTRPYAQRKAGARKRGARSKS